MSISLTDGTVTVALHADLFWSDEQNWHPVEQSAERSITGALIVQAGTRTAGRPITLEPIDESSAWMPRVDVDQLRALAAVAGKEMTLTLRGVAHPVIFRHQDTAMEAEPVVHYNDVENADYYLVTLRFMEV